jgi:hypothetical protein
MAFFFSVAIAFNAGLLFLIQPLIAKMILPWLGGSPAVWNTSLIFYQTCLLAGYGYAHLGTLWLGTRAHAWLHLVLILTASVLLPVALPVHWFTAPADNPVGLVLAALTVTIGLPFFVLSAGAPLMQRWFAYCQHQAARDPYFLYAASNAGSIVGLLAYPFVLEPRLTLSQQNYLWFCGYLFLAILLSVCVLYFLRSFGLLGKRIENHSGPTRTAVVPSTVTRARRVRWVAWSLIPSSLLMGLNSYLTTDIAAMPLLWVLPLSGYLFSFVLAFARPSWATSSSMLRPQAFFLLGAAITLFMHATEPLWIVLPLHLVSFVLTAIVCHGQLAKDKPEVSGLTDYYFWISLGGALGGAFNALIAPQIFTVVIEYPLAIAAAAFLRPYVGRKNETTLQRYLDGLLPPAMFLAVLFLTWTMKQHALLAPSNERFLFFAASGVLCLSFAVRPVRFGIGMATIAFAYLWYPTPYGKTLYTERSFFGAYRVTLDLETKKHVLFQGTTIHGAQSIEPNLRLKPMSYYHRTGPAGQVLAVRSVLQPNGSIAVVGLGSGALACHGTPAQKFTFYEIDPLVEKIARDQRLFTYLRDCPPRSEVVIGDARISLAQEANRRYDILILDAFSSDSIPTHLLTREAIELYLSRTAPDGLLLFHISNRYLDLAPMLGRLATSLHLVALIQNDFSVSTQEKDEGKSGSRWVILSRGEHAVAPFLNDRRWQRPDPRLVAALWTDDFSDLLSVISFSNWQFPQDLVRVWRGFMAR